MLFAEKKNFNKNKMESKMENPKHGFRKMNGVQGVN